ncbi:Os06g0642400 [Oryza sativa Japonica Group]|uniref:Os06g0642400 protein n=1 Tax=Oryza sativa subsp. japonica TaxID=39947 RepID=A0A0P0WZA6_ORYSJ|nr:hypothetical protein EE612_035609 [Oryza sativa]BAS98819.1 Os06g0642400 [Oryza sativa Japonica Group]
MIGTSIRSCTRRVVTPLCSFMSISTPSGSFQSKWYKRLASASSNVARPNAIPGHMRRPAPNGIYSKFVPLKLIPAFSNLSGINSSAWLQYLGSLFIAHIFTSTIVPLGTSNPNTWQVVRHTRNSSRGPGGCNRSVSLMTKFM